MRSRTARRFALSMSLMAGLAATVASWPVDAFAQSRAANILRDTQRQAFRSQGLSESLMNRYISFEGEDVQADRFMNGGSFQISVGSMVADVPNQNITVTSNFIVYNDTRENVCVRARVKNRHAPHSYRIINDEFSMIILANSSQAIMFLSTEVPRGSSLNHLDVSRYFNGASLLFWIPDMSQPAGTGRRCDTTEPPYFSEWFSMPLDDDVFVYYDEELQRRLGGQRD